MSKYGHCITYLMEIPGPASAIHHQEASGSGEPSAGAVRSALDRVSSDARFAKAESLVRLLRYNVEAVLSGRADQLKEYAVGTEVFGRGADFDPRIDPIVRVQARKLRA